MRYLTIVFCIIYLLISIFFYHSIWEQLWTPEDPNVLLIQGETPVYEFVAEQVRINILSGYNPFASTDRVLYPMGWNIAMEDIAPFNGFIFLLLRPFLSVHQAFIAIMVLSVFLSNITMYWLLRVVKIRRSIAFISGLLYGFTPFVAYRIAGHPTYIALYLFTLSAIFFLLLYQAKTVRQKSLFAVCLGLSFVLMVLTNLYFVIMFVLLVCLWVLCSFLFQFEKTWLAFRTLFPYIVLSGAVGLVLLTPWMIELIKNIELNPRSVPQGFGDSIVLSSDIFGFFWPRQNRVYTPAVDYIISRFGYKPFYESFIYPGVLLIIPTILYMRYRKKISAYLFPLYMTALTILVLTWGPVLKVGTLQTIIPLPYQIIHYIPYFQMARAPGRFIVGFVFLMCIVFAFLLQYVLVRVRGKQWYILSIIMVVFFIDHTNHIFPPLRMPVPDNIYRYLASQPPTPLLEIPFSIRDGLKNHGHLHSVWSMQPQFRHGHPLFGIYAGRVPDNQFAYFQTHPFFGSLGELIRIENQDKAATMSKLSSQNLAQAADVFGFEYVLLKEKEAYSTYAATLLSTQFKPIMKDNGYVLYKKQSKNRKLTTGIQLSKEDTRNLLQDGWSPPEREGRWAVGGISTLYLNAKSGAQKLILKAHSIAQDQHLTVYMNRKKAAQIPIGVEREKHTIYVSPDMVRDVNMIQFIPSRMIQPKELDPASQDERELSIFYSAIQLE